MQCQSAASEIPRSLRVLCVSQLITSLRSQRTVAEGCRHTILAVTPTAATALQQMQQRRCRSVTVLQYPLMQPKLQWISYLHGAELCDCMDDTSATHTTFSSHTTSTWLYQDRPSTHKLDACPSGTHRPSNRYVSYPPPLLPPKTLAAIATHSCPDDLI
jgi:hypothetical protein